MKNLMSKKNNATNNDVKGYICIGNCSGWCKGYCEGYCKGYATL